MALFAEHHGVRVTERKSIKTPFIAPDVAPVRLIDQELEKGSRDWTDGPAPANLTGSHLPKGMVDRHLEEMTVGIVSYKTRVERTPRRTRKRKG